ncbi:MAG: calmodulin-binding protein [Pirellulales bacterium]|nr:calmodulin-binding protein [Pirellulales bacterium]
MIRRIVFVLLAAAFIASVFCVADAQAQQSYGRQWGHSYSTQDWNRMYHYPYVYYPQNFWGADYYRSSEDLYHRYPPEMRTPVYHKQWQNYYPQHRGDPRSKQHQFFPMFTGQRHSGVRYHQGHHFIADVF